MGKRKEIKLFNNRYQGSLAEEECSVLEQLLELDACNGCVSDLRHIIYDLSDADVETIKWHGFSWADMKKTANLENHIGTLEDYQTVGVAYLY